MNYVTIHRHPNKTAKFNNRRSLTSPLTGKMSVKIVFYFCGGFLRHPWVLVPAKAVDSKMAAG